VRWWIGFCGETWVPPRIPGVAARSSCASRHRSRAARAARGPVVAGVPGTDDAAGPV